MSRLFELKKKMYQFFNIFEKKISDGSILFIKSENKNWVLRQISIEYRKFLTKIFDYVTFDEKFLFNKQSKKNIIMSKYFALKNINSFENSICFPYYHGTYDKNQFYNEISIINKNLNKIDRIQVTNQKIEQALLENNVPHDKIMKIPISIDFEIFKNLSSVSKKTIRDYYKIPQNAFVIGNFQKDGDGWFFGNNPKLIKGPDIFLKVIKILKDKIPNLYIFLTGPSRGYTKIGLRKMGVPFYHRYFRSYEDIIKSYKSLDTYLFCSREEGGPRALLECFASKIPIVSTNVGQTQDILINKVNGFKTNNFNVEEMVNYIYQNIYQSEFSDLQKILDNAYIDAEKYSYNNQIPQWKKFYRL